METSKDFIAVIDNYLLQKAEIDPEFKPVFQKLDKNINQCINYILSEVKKSGCNGFTDAEIFAIAEQYYRIDTNEKIENLNCKVVVNHSIPPKEVQKPKQADLFAHAPVENCKTASSKTNPQTSLELF